MIPFLLFLILLATPVIAETPCETAIESNTVTVMGSASCGVAFMNDPAVQTIMGAVKDAKCYKKLGKAAVNKAITRGGDDWDRYVAELGKDGACQQLAANMKHLSNLMKNPPD